MGKEYWTTPIQSGSPHYLSYFAVWVFAQYMSGSQGLRGDAGSCAVCVEVYVGLLNILESMKDDKNMMHSEGFFGIAVSSCTQTGDPYLLLTFTNIELFNRLGPQTVRPIFETPS